MILTPVIEETLFRGFLFNAFRRISLVLAVVLTTLLFGIWHFELSWWSLAKHLPFGLVMAVFVARTNSVYPPILAHATWNLLFGAGVFPKGWLEPTYANLVASGVLILGGTAILFRSTRRCE